jgi:muramoyltetrapeptide carboxypeptidase LdcA involved in peptidoglycan recycling
MRGRWPESGTTRIVAVSSKAKSVHKILRGVKKFTRVGFTERCGAKVERAMPCLLGLENASR